MKLYSHKGLIDLIANPATRPPLYVTIAKAIEAEYKKQTGTDPSEDYVNSLMNDISMLRYFVYFSFVDNELTAFEGVLLDYSKDYNEKRARGSNYYVRAVWPLGTPDMMKYHARTVPEWIRTAHLDGKNPEHLMEVEPFLVTILPKEGTMEETDVLFFIPGGLSASGRSKILAAINRKFNPKKPDLRVVK